MKEETRVRFIGTDCLHLRDDGRTVDGRIVPYNEIADITELDDSGNLMRYREQFLPHSLARVAQGVAKRGNASFIAYMLEHEESFDAKIGHAIDLRDEEDGAYATFRLYDSRDILKVQSMLRESHTGMSVMFYDIRSPKVDGDLVSRVQVGIKHVAATPSPAYETAGITSMRNGDELPPLTELARVRAMLAELKRE